MNRWLLCVVGAVILVVIDAQHNYRQFYSNPLKMLINKYPAYVNVSPRQDPVVSNQKLPAEPAQLTISGNKPVEQQVWKRRRIVGTPIRITPFLYSMNPVEIDVDQQ